MQYTQTCKNSPGSLTPTGPSLPSAQPPVEVGHTFSWPSLQLPKLVQGGEISWGLQEHHESCIRGWEKLPLLLSVCDCTGEISIAGLLHFLINLQILLWKEWARKLRCSRGTGRLQKDGSERTSKLRVPAIPAHVEILTNRAMMRGVPDTGTLYMLLRRQLELESSGTKLFLVCRVWQESGINHTDQERR